MKRIFLLLCVFLFANFCRSQLLSWTPEFPKDNDNVTITVDATKGNQGLLGFAGNVYVHVGVITNLSTGPTNWRYSKFTWGSTEAAALATSADPKNLKLKTLKLQNAITLELQNFRTPELENPEKKMEPRRGSKIS